MFTLQGWQTSTPVDLPGITGGTCRGLVGKICGVDNSGTLRVSAPISTFRFPLSHTVSPGGLKFPREGGADAMA